MFRKWKLKKQISKLKQQIEALEQKRIRSQAALVTAILTDSTPSDEDVDYFNKYTTKIEEVRSEMLALKQQLESM